MKLRFKGGNTEKVTTKDAKTGKPVEVTKEQLTQTFEETEYHWPKKGSVLVVPANTGSWLLYKCGKYLEHVEEEAGQEESTAPRRLVAVVPEETKAAEAK